MTKKNRNRNPKNFDDGPLKAHKAKPIPIDEKIVNEVAMDPFHIAHKVSESANILKKGLESTDKLIKQQTPKLKTLASKSPSIIKLMKPAATAEIKKEFDKYVNSTSDSISNAVSASNATTSLNEEILNKITNSVGKTIEENLSLSQDLFKCRNARDVFDFNQKLFEANFNSTMNLCIDIGHLLQKFTSKNINLSSSYFEKNLKGFTSR